MGDADNDRGPYVTSDRAAERLHRLNRTTQFAVLAPIGVLLIAIDARSWWEAAVLAAGVVAGLVMSARWAFGGVSRVALPCLAVSAAVWVIGALLTDSPTAFYGISIVGPIVVPQLPRHRGIAAVGLVAFVTAVGAARLAMPAGDGAVISYVVIPLGVTALGTGLMFVNQKFYDLLAKLEESREREAELAVYRERVRFAGDLHDIQGHTLHVVKLKATLAEKLVRTDADRAEQELREIHALVGDTITQTKELAYAQRRLNLSAELENAKNLFEAAGIRVRVERDAEVDPRAGELLGQVLRETTTNILRHAQAGQVRITLSESGITIVNDGAYEGDGASEGDGGHGAPPAGLRGLAVLRERLAGSGGELTVEQRDGRFTTAATFPPGRSGDAARTGPGSARAGAARRDGR